MVYIKKNIKHTLAVLISVTFCGLIYIYPMQTDFKLSLGVIAYTLGVLLFPLANNIFTIVVSGCLVTISRAVLTCVTSGTSIFVGIIENFPVIGFYFVFGTCLYVLGKSSKKWTNTQAYFIIFIVVGDILGNIAESIIYNNLDRKLFITIFFSAIIRTSVSLTILFLVENQKLYISKKEQQNKYAQLHELISNVYAEAFYLKKSIRDIDNVMECSYKMYSNPNLPQNFKQDALNISKDIHEIRKDFDRALKGFNALVDNTTTLDKLSLVEIKTITEKNIKRVLKYKSEIFLTFSVDGDLQISKYYDIFTIVNNLITNAIDACEESSNINCKFTASKDILYIWVQDDGKGIDKDIQDYIFSPGFTTKFDVESGVASTGIGLCHVENVVKDLGGDISLKSNLGETVFTVTIPIINII